MLLTENGGEVCPVNFLLSSRFFCIFHLGFCRLCFVILIHREKIENEDSLRTVECLRGRLLAERVASRNAKEEVEQMENKVLYFFLLPIIFSFFCEYSCGQIDVIVAAKKNFIFSLPIYCKFA